MPPLSQHSLFHTYGRIALSAVVSLFVIAAAGSAALAVTPAESNGFVSDLQMRGFNPQPEPPRVSGFVSEAAKRGFNPQPEPPSPDSLMIPILKR